jgi:hypothetical protein
LIRKSDDCSLVKEPSLLVRKREMSNTSKDKERKPCKEDKLDGSLKEAIKANN